MSLNNKEEHVGAFSSMPLISIPADAFRGHGSSLPPRFAQSGCFRSCCSRRSRRLHSNQLELLLSQNDVFSFYNGPHFLYNKKTNKRCCDYDF